GDESIHEALILDEVRLRQILINLLGNAVKFTETGYIRLSVTSCETDQTSGGRVELMISVSDSGIGIPQDQQNRIFGAFEQTAGQKTAKFGGTGLGLAITSRLVEMLDGDISVESEEEKGSTFTITLHGVEVGTSETLLAKEEKQLDFESITFKPATILITDDIDYNRELLTSYLNQFDFNFIYAENGREAIEKAKIHHPDLIILDMKMPVMDGYEASKIINNDDELKDHPIIAVTASALKSDEELIATLCDAYLRKPASKLELVAELMRFLPHTELAQKLTVIEPPLAEEKASGPLVIPDKEELKKLHPLAMIGDMDDIKSYADSLEKKDIKYMAFSSHLRELAHNFKSKEILKLIEKHLDNE
ncbi:hypothetical protein BVY04_00710, partial [bacterium M21]